MATTTRKDGIRLLARFAGYEAAMFLARAGKAREGVYGATDADIGAAALDSATQQRSYVLGCKERGAWVAHYADGWWAAKEDLSLPGFDPERGTWAGMFARAAERQRGAV